MKNKKILTSKLNVQKKPGYLVIYTFSLLILLLLSAGAFAQNKVSGKITDENGKPLPGISVLASGSKAGTATNEAGEYQISVTNNSTLTFTGVGYATQSLKAAGKTVIDLSLKVSTAPSLEDVVVVGYGSQKRKDVTGAITSVPKSRFTELPVTNLLQAIEGSVSGVTITQNSSVPGSSASVMVRGINTIPSQTSNSSFQPYIILDGIPFNGVTNDINPNDIESIDILKDVSAVAVYGVKGANGVIIITTKRGQNGKPVIRYNGYTGFENFAHTLKAMSGPDYIQKFKDYSIQTGQPQSSPVPNASELPNYTAGITTDWIKEVSQQGHIQDHNISLSGGSKDVRYYVSGEYLQQRGVLKGYQYQRANIRSNIDINVTDYLSVGTSIFYTNNNYDGGRVNLLLAGQISPYGQEYNANGKYNFYPMFPDLLYTSPLTDLYKDVYNRSNNFNINGYAELRPGFLKGLKYRVNAVYSYAPSRNADYTGRDAGNQIGAANNFSNESRNYTIDNLLTFTRDFGNHHLDITGLYSAQKGNYYQTNAGASGFINDQLSYFNLGSGATQTSGSFSNQSTTLSQMGRINYSYQSKYLLTLTARRDGYSAFGINTNKYGVFPSAAIAWNISNEDFIKNVSTINNLKLRLSYGKAGNQAVGNNQTSTTDATNRWTFNGIGTTGAVANVLGNADLHWETTTGFNGGVDFAILKNKIRGTIDYYNTKTKDILLLRQLPIITGFSNIITNLGRTANHGIEITLNTTNVQTKDFRWETSLNYSANKNKLTNLYGIKDSTGKEISDIGNRWFIGQPVRVIYDYQLIGVWQVGEDHAMDPSAKPGDLKFADTNGDGKITGDDRVILGTTLPKWIAGFTNTFHYKNFHLSIFVQTFQGALRNNAVLDNADQSGRINTPAEIGYWTVDNKSNTRPALSYFNSRGYGYPVDNSYTRLKDVTFSYTFSPSILTKLHLSALTAYASGRNLYTWTKWVGWDPEYDYSRQTSTNSNNYPLVRSIVFGINVTLK